jgi:hypothetical protein
MEIDGTNNADVPERLKIPEMVVAGNDQVGFACDRAFQNPIIVVIRGNSVDCDLGNDNLRDLRQQLQAGYDLFVIPIETASENSGQLIHDGRRYQKYIALFQCREPNVKWAAGPPGEGRDIDVAVENDPKPSGFGDTHE